MQFGGDCPNFRVSENGTVPFAAGGWIHNFPPHLDFFEILVLEVLLLKTNSDKLTKCIS
jgi:hypothetical protein